MLSDNVILFSRVCLALLFFSCSFLDLQLPGDHTCFAHRSKNIVQCSAHNRNSPQMHQVSPEFWGAFTCGVCQARVGTLQLRTTPGSPIHMKQEMMVLPPSHIRQPTHNHSYPFCGTIQEKVMEQSQEKAGTSSPFLTSSLPALTNVEISHVAPSANLPIHQKTCLSLSFNSIIRLELALRIQEDCYMVLSFNHTQFKTPEQDFKSQSKLYEHSKLILNGLDTHYFVVEGSLEMLQ